MRTFRPSIWDHVSFLGSSYCRSTPSPIQETGRCPETAEVIQVAAHGGSQTGLNCNVSFSLRVLGKLMSPGFEPRVKLEILQQRELCWTPQTPKPTPDYLPFPPSSSAQLTDRTSGASASSLPRPRSVGETALSELSRGDAPTDVEIPNPSPIPDPDPSANCCLDGFRGIVHCGAGPGVRISGCCEASLFSRARTDVEGGLEGPVSGEGLRA